MVHIVLKPPPGKASMLGNEAIVRGALEAGVAVATTYPGTPSSEIGDTFYEIYKSAGIYFEFSTNEKVALEVAASAALSGLRSIVAMKHVGLNVAADSFMSLSYTGVKAGMVIVSADDPGMHSSQNEQDNRIYGQMAHIPVLEPSYPQEAKELTKIAFEISEKFKVPVLLRTTTRVSHMRGIVELGEIKLNTFERKKFEKNPPRYVIVPALARKDRLIQLERDKELEEFSENFVYNRIETYGNAPELGIIASGVSYSYVIDVIKSKGISAKVLKITMSYPLPRRKIAEFLKDVKRVIVFEETEPFIERQVKAIAHDYGIDVKIHGKEDGTVRYQYEMTPDEVYSAIYYVSHNQKPDTKVTEINIKVPQRPPTFCPGCPHRATYYAAKRVFGTNLVAPTDIGCYTLGFSKPFNLGDLLFSMGSSFGTASGLGHFVEEPVVAFIGDSTFYHAGIPGLINAVVHNTPAIFVIMDNATTAMTGGQPTPEVPSKPGKEESWRSINLENVIRGLGLEKIMVVDPYDVPKTIEVFKEAKEYVKKEKKPAVVISRRICALEYVRMARRQNIEIVPYKIDQEKCTRCYVCVKTFSCAAFSIDEDGSVHIRSDLCTGCGACAYVCPFNAIVRGDNQ